MRHFLIFSVYLFLASNAIAQKHCGSEDLQEEKKVLHPELYKQQQKFEAEITQIIAAKKTSKLSAASAIEQIYVIPVVVHVIHNTSSGTIGGLGNTNISDAQILSQIQILNEDYRRKAGTNGFNTDPLGADVNIEFCLANTDPNGNFTTGINRVYNSKSSFNVTASDETLLKSLSYWPSDQYLNIWVTKLAGGYLGYAQYPAGASVPGLPGDDGAATDGVVIDHRAFGNTGTAGTGGYPLYNLGRTATHEIGHWLGLIHIWGDAVCGDDFVADTPEDKDANDDTDCIDSSDCIIPGIFTQDMINNYLDYSIDVCMNIFTVGQKTRMRTVMETSPRRMALLYSKGCCINSSSASVPFEDDFETGSYLTNGWTTENLDSNVTWEINTSGGFGNGSFSVFMENDSANLNDIDRFTTPFLNFKEIEPYLEFDLAYAQDPSINTDTLIVSYGSGCNSWTPLLTLFGNTLITTSAVTSDFTPTAGDWKRIKLDLDALNNKSSIRISFENHSAVKNNIYIDNVNIYKTTPRLYIKPYPNPARESINIEVLFRDEQDIKYELYDMLGQKVFEITDKKQTSYIKTLDVSNLATGMYILKVSTTKEKAIRKVLLNF